jgi:hypothetical protein
VCWLDEEETENAEQNFCATRAAMFSKKIKPEEVWKALAEGDLHFFEKHKGKLLGLDIRDARFKESLLHRACYAGQLEIVEFLIAEGFSVNDDEGELGATPLHSAAAGNHQDIAKYVIFLVTDRVPVTGIRQQGRTKEPGGGVARG